MSHHHPLDSEREAAVWCCERAVKEVVAAEAAIACRDLRALTSARLGEYLRHSIRLAVARDEREDAVERLARAVAWLRETGGPDPTGRYARRLEILVALARRRARVALAGPPDLN